jgi:two-component system response regulator AtoC
MKKRILIIEDDEIMRVTIEDSLKASGFQTHSCDRGAAGINALKEEEFSLVITDMRLPDMEGLDALKKIKNINDRVPVVIITAYGTIKDAVAAMRLGAFEYITKPFSLEEFTLVINRALEVKELKDENIRLRKDLTDCYGYANIIGESAEILKILDLIQKISQTDSTVLILGENGTGKELIASAIHYQSRRRNGPLIRVNCAVFPENLVESELFGYEKGAFTGAAQRKPGRFERADKGTIFLDEIGDLPLTVQIKLLQVLQDGSFERLGGTEALHVDVRVIAATNRELEEDVKSGRFREDLYYRLNVIPVNVPPLRQRSGDIPLLIDHFLGMYNCRFGKRVAMTSDAISTLMEYDFPGNIRELGNIIERCIALLTEDKITRNDLPPHILKSQRVQSPRISLNEVAAEAEKAYILRILSSTRGNKTKAAEILGISRKTLWEKVKSYNIEYSS